MPKCGFCSKDAIVVIVYTDEDVSDDTQEEDVCKFHYYDIYNSCSMIAISKVLDPISLFEEGL